MATLSALEINGLKEGDARALLDTALTAPLDERVRDQVVAETRGNPLALLELPRSLTGQELAGGFGLPGTARLSAAMEESFRRGVEAFPDQTRRLLLLTAADPLGDPALLWQAAARLNIDAEAAKPGIEAGMAEFGTRVRFRHPLARSAAYRWARFTPDNRCALSRSPPQRVGGELRRGLSGCGAPSSGGPGSLRDRHVGR
jgi:hypothetical protein